MNKSLPEKDHNEQNKSEYKREITIAIFSVIGIILIWGISWLLIDNYVTSEDKTKILEARGTFGDKFGAINSLFAGLAFAGIIFTILLQRKELQLQRDELSSTREVFEKQNDMLSQEKFENTYFQMLSLFHSIVNSLDLRRSGTVIKSGRDCFQSFYKEFLNEVDRIISRENTNIDLVHQSYIGRENLHIQFYLEAYNTIYTKHRANLSHYFRTIYHIIKLIDKSEIADKNQYTSIARAQLSSYEQVLLFYNCLHINGKEKFKPLIEEYSLFKNIDRALLLSEKNMSEYKKSAFEK